MKTTLRITKFNEGEPNLEFRNANFLINEENIAEISPDEHADINVFWDIFTYPKNNVKSDLYTNDDFAIVELKPTKVEFSSRTMTYLKKGERVTYNKPIEFTANVVEWSVMDKRNLDFNKIQPKLVIIDCKYKVAQVYF